MSTPISPMLFNNPSIASLGSESSDFDSDDSDSDSDDSDFDSDDENQHPPEYYQAEADSLDVSRLRRKLYSGLTQEKLDDVKNYWDR
jgi:hypothetical protein